MMLVWQDRIGEARARIAKATHAGEVSAAALLVRHGDVELAQGFGQATVDTVFLLASISKPMTAAGVLILRDHGELRLDDPVRTFLPEFSGGERDRVTIRHLLTHTSGLPDMLPENLELRKRHAPLAEFVNRVYETPLLFTPGSAVSYQSMGILLAAEIVQRITQLPFREFLHNELFGPLGMADTSLGLGRRAVADTARSQVSAQSTWAWNTPYWRDLGAPWGGVHSTARDVATFLAAFQLPESPVFKAGTTREMTTLQTPRHEEAWGLGWRLGPAWFGHSCSSATYGHYGLTGTIAWHDPETTTSCIVLTTKPVETARDGLLGPISDLVSEAVQS